MRSSKRTRTNPGKWKDGEPVLVYMVQHLKPSELPDTPWALNVTKDEIEAQWPPTPGGDVVVKHVLVEDTEEFLRELLKEVNEGPTSPRARTGELQGILRALAKVMTRHRRFLDWKRRQGNA